MKEGEEVAPSAVDMRADRNKERTIVGSGNERTSPAAGRQGVK